MAKRPIGDVNALLSTFAADKPTQRAPTLSVVPPAAPPSVTPAATPVASVPKPVPVAAAERVIRQIFEIRESQRVQLDNLARAQGMTTRSFILRALQAQGLDVPESDLIDRRKRPRD